MKKKTLPNPIKVSEVSQGFVECLISLNTLYSQIYDVIVKMYGDGDSAEKIMSGDFLEKNNEYQKLVGKYLLINIGENIGGSEITEI